MDGEFTFSSAGQVHELELAMKRVGGWNAALVTVLCGGNNAGLVRDFLLGDAEIVARDHFRETRELTIQIPALPRPTLEELREQFPWIREKDGIERDTSPTHAVTLRLGTVLGLDDERVDGAEYERRLAPKLDSLLGYQQAVWLLKNQDAFPALMEQCGKIYIDFPGLVVVDADGDRYFPYLSRGGERWVLYWYWIDDGLSRDGRIAVSSK